MAWGARKKGLAVAAVVISLAACSSGSSSSSDTTDAAATTSIGASTTEVVSSTESVSSTEAASTSEATTAAADTTTTTEATSATTAATEPTSTLPAGATAGLDDYDGNGEPDPTCGTQDFGAGLVLRVPCEINTANEPAQGTTLVDGSLFRMPGSTDVDLTGISGSLLLARDAAGQKVVIVVFNSDGLFATGSDVINSTETLDGTVALINRLYANAAIQVRGHTDARGSASANQALSERRAANVLAYLQGHATKASSFTSVGLGSTQPLAVETNPDGSANAEAQHFDRRVEIVLRLAG